MTLLPEYSDSLSRAGDRIALRRTSTRRRARLAAIVVAGTLALGTVAALATTFWDPPLGDDRRGHPVASASPPPADQLARFGVLRRDATDVDQGEQTRYALSMFSPSEIRGIRTAYVRLLGTHDNGLGDVLVPAAEANGKSDALCLFMRDPVDGGGVGCFSTADVLEGRAVLGMSGMPAGATAAPGGPTIRGPKGSHFKRVPAPPRGPLTLAGLVPDGVAAVRVATTTAQVHNNFFRIRDAAGPQALAQRIEWLDRDGRIIEH